MKKHTGSITDPPKNIGIIPITNASDDICAQLLAIAIANYLTGVEHKKVTLINMSEINIFENLAWYHNINFYSDDRYFKLHNVIYYPHYTNKYLSETNSDYTIFIGKSAFDKTQLKLVTGSLDPWALKNYADFLKRMINIYSTNRDTWHFLAHCLSEKDKRMLEKDFNVSIKRLPIDLDPFKIKRTDFPFFTDILR